MTRLYRNAIVWTLVVAGALGAAAENAQLTWTLKDGRVLRETVALVPTRAGVETLALRRDAIAAKGAKELEIVPAFATAKKGEAGYWFSSYGVYGEYDRDNGTYLAGAERASMPLFGWDNPRGACLALVTSLKYFVRARIVAKDGAYRVAAVVQRELCEDPYEDLVIEYHRRPAGTGYAALAKIYRQYQLDRGAVKPFRERFRENKTLERAILMPEVRVRQAWKPVPSPFYYQSPENEPPVKAVITFDRVKEIVRALKTAGVGECELCLVGWNIGGHDGRFPQYFPAEPKLGGNGKLREAIRYALDNGFLIVPHGNFHEGYTIADTFDAEWTRKKKDGSIMLGRDGKVTWGGGGPHLMCAQRAYERFCIRDFPRMAQFGFKGIGYFDVVTICEPTFCHDRRHPLNPAETAAYWGRCAALSRRAFGGFASESGNDYFAGDLDFSLYTYFGDPRDVERRHRAGKCLPRRIVPIWQIVYNGIIANNPFTTTVNPTIKDRYSQIKAIEFNARPTFYFYAKFLSVGANWMGDEDLGCANAEELARAVAAIKAGYDRYQGLRHLQLETIEDHLVLPDGVTKTVFSNGETLVCDYDKLTWRLERSGDGVSARMP